MNPYFAGIILLGVFSFTSGVIWFSNRAGRHSAQINTDKSNTAKANATTQATERMLEARTNGVKDENALIGDLDKGSF